MRHLLEHDPDVYRIVSAEKERIEKTLDMIAAESHAPWSIYEAQGSAFNLKAAEGYRKKKNEALSTDDQPAYHDTAVPNAWENHMMDALRHLAMAYRYQTIGGKLIGRTRPRYDTPYARKSKFGKKEEYNVRRHGFV